jgi:hypothetical protein
METAEAISAIRSNWPDERYTMLREALTKAIAALEAMEAGQPAHNCQSTPCSCGCKAVIHLCNKCFREETTPVADYNDPQ